MNAAVMVASMVTFFATSGTSGTSGTGPAPTNAAPTQVAPAASPTSPTSPRDQAAEPLEAPDPDWEGALAEPRPAYLGRRHPEAAIAVADRGTWMVAASAGYPWWSARVQRGLPGGFAPFAELQTALARRWRPALGLAKRWLTRPHLQISGEVLVGWLLQRGALARRGPNAELRLRLAIPLRRVAPYVMAGTQHTLLADRTAVIRPEGESRSWSFRSEWTAWGTVGLVAGLSRRVSLDLGVDLTWVDAPASIAIPGAHAGLIIGGIMGGIMGGIRGGIRGGGRRSRTAGGV